jgi:chromosome partitioning protein
VIVVADEDAELCRGATALHVIAGLITCGQRVASIDLHAGDDGLSYCIAMRSLGFVDPAAAAPAMPNHHRIALVTGDRARLDSALAFVAFDRAVTAIGTGYDFLVIASPRRDGDLIRLVHALADTVVTPLIDSAMEVDALSLTEAGAMTADDLSPYAALVREARRLRRRTDGGLTDWVVLRDRPTSINSESRHRLGRRLDELALQLGVRLADNLCDFAEIGAHDRGMTAFDDPGAATGALAHRMVETLRLDLNQHRRSIAEARALWAAASAKPLETDDIFA